MLHSYRHSLQHSCKDTCLQQCSNDKAECYLSKHMHNNLMYTSTFNIIVHYVFICIYIAQLIDTFWIFSPVTTYT